MNRSRGFLFETIQVELGERSYPIEIGDSLWEHLAGRIEQIFSPGRVVVVTDETVGELYEPTLLGAFYNRKWKTTIHRMQPGEQHKTLQTVDRLYQDILETGCDRKTPLVALGGGVPGDTGGFIAATLLRGIPYIQVPTTLLAMVDSSVGGKTGVDMPQGKNLVGAFYQPSLVVISIDTLSTLPKREFSAGMAEVIKYGVIWDADLFEELESGFDALMKGHQTEIARIVRRCCEIKAEVVSKDERESGLRAILNFGHTVGHALEAVTEYGEFLHGEAVAIGMVVETVIAEQLGRNLGDLLPRLRALLQKAHLPVSPPDQCDPQQIWARMHSDKKSLAGRIRMVLPERLGSVNLVPDIDPDLFEQSWNLCRTA